MPVRLVLWAHVSGTFYPWLPPAFLRVPQRFVFTSAYSYENPFWDAATCAWTKEHAAMINSVGYFSSEALCHEKHDGFVIGYVGTLSYAKLHPEFCRFCARVKDIPGARFRLVGDAENEAQIRRDAEPFGIAEQLSFAGYVDDVTAELRRMDVFVYLLNLQHFGTTENVLLEAMKAGLAVVALDQCAEKHIVHHGETGLLVRTPEEYAAGHLENAKNIPHDQIGQQIAAHVPNKNTPINLYCRSGRRAETAKQVLESMGYTNVQNRGGYEQLKQSGMR